jgi:hypothetical protein
MPDHCNTNFVLVNGTWGLLFVCRPPSNTRRLIASRSAKGRFATPGNPSPQVDLSKISTRLQIRVSGNYIRYLPTIIKYAFTAKASVLLSPEIL